MKCPKCGMIYGQLDTVCRRCKIDLRTGEPAEITAASAHAKPGGASRLDRLKAVGQKSKPGGAPGVESTGAMKAAPAAPDQVSEEIPIAPARPVLSSSRVKGKPAKKRGSLISNITGTLKSMRSTGSSLKNIECIECQGTMHLQRIQEYGPRGPAALIALSVVLLIAGVKAWPLLLLAPVSLGLGVFYIRRGATRWHCPTCGYSVSRI